jgi:hypothetical protein
MPNAPTLIACPGRCGTVFHAGPHARQQMASHMRRCEKGIAVLELMRQFAVWMLGEFDADRPEAERAALARELVTEFMGAQ